MSDLNKDKKIVVVDYGVGNLYSLIKALGRFSKNVTVSDDPGVVRRADALILPGVGAFASGMYGLELRDLIKPIKSFAESGKPILGICLGAQIMLDTGFEFGKHKGLGLIKGKVEIFPNSVRLHEKIPHIGWNTILPAKNGGWNKTILDKISKEVNVYFVHSYILMPQKEENILAFSRYGGLDFCAAIRKGNIYGTQFHPEKSGEIGLAIIENFVSLV